MSSDIKAMQAEIERLKAENAALTKQATSKITCKVSEKGAVSVYGFQRFPVTLYAEQWERLLSEGTPVISAFIKANRPKLMTKAQAVALKAAKASTEEKVS